jgi:hypothetical protein
VEYGVEWGHGGMSSGWAVRRKHKLNHLGDFEMGEWMEIL